VQGRGPPFLVRNSGPAMFLVKWPTDANRNLAPRESIVVRSKELLVQILEFPNSLQNVKGSIDYLG